MYDLRLFYFCKECNIPFNSEVVELFECSEWILMESWESEKLVFMDSEGQRRYHWNVWEKQNHRYQLQNHGNWRWEFVIAKWKNERIGNDNRTFLAFLLMEWLTNTPELRIHWCSSQKELQRYHAKTEFTVSVLDHVEHCSKICWSEKFLQALDSKCTRVSIKLVQACHNSFVLRYFDLIFFCLFKKYTNFIVT